ncbi:MAG: hypothetical protein PHV36_04310 [Elusimicrobiales bacterium]|nr:hypothetical protein [Elusimicrobiales bacterium]
MKLGSCPKCGSRKVRTGKIYLLHLARLAPGSRRRYCRNCRSRWIGSEAVFLPSARLAGILFLCVSAALALNYLKEDGWFEPQPGLSHPAGRDNAWTVTTDSDRMAGEIRNVMRGDVTGAYGQALGGRNAGAGGGLIRWREGQLMEEYSAYLLSGRGEGPQTGRSQEMLDLLRRLSVIGKTPQQVAREVDTSDKRTLWNKYGGNFASKQDAKAAYDDFQRHRSELPK